MTLFLQPNKMKGVLFGYWLTIPLVFGLYIFVLATVKNVSAVTIFTSIPSLTLTSIIVFLLFFQIFGLFIIGNSSDCRHSFMGSYLKFSMLQQLLSVNIPGLILCLLFYRSLLNDKEEVELPKQVRWTMYGLMGFISIITILIVWIRVTL